MNLPFALAKPSSLHRIEKFLLLSQHTNLVHCLLFSYHSVAFTWFDSATLAMNDS